MLATTVDRRRTGFTLIEVLIVVVIMAVLAATIIPQFSSSAEDAKASTLLFNLNQFRSQIELYKLDHSGAIPVVAADTFGIPTLPQMYSKTDVTGTIGTGTAFPLGPYVANKRLPSNPINNSYYVTGLLTAAWPPLAATSDGGWFYNKDTGEIIANDADHLTN